jgi:ferredoxin-fold anticodon binding domain-containing protein
MRPKLTLKKSKSKENKLKITAVKLLKTISQREAVCKRYSMIHRYADISLLSCIITKNSNLSKETSFQKPKLINSICLGSQRTVFEGKKW